MDDKRKKALNFLNQRGLTIDYFDELDSEQIDDILEIRKEYLRLVVSLQQLKRGEQVFNQDLFYPKKYATPKRDKNGVCYVMPCVQRLENGEIEFRCCEDCECEQSSVQNEIFNYKKNTLKTIVFTYTPHDFKILLEKNINALLDKHNFYDLEARPLTAQEKETLKAEAEDEYEIIDDEEISQKHQQKTPFQNTNYFKKNDVKVQIEQLEINTNKLAEFIKAKNLKENNSKEKQKNKDKIQ